MRGEKESNQQENQDSLIETKLPVEMFFKIFEHFIDLKSLVLVNKQFFNIVQTFRNIKTVQYKNMTLSQKLRGCLLSSTELYLEQNFSYFSWHGGPKGKQRVKVLKTLATSTNDPISLLLLSISALSIKNVNNKPVIYIENFLFPLLKRTGVVPENMKVDPVDDVIDALITHPNSCLGSVLNKKNDTHTTTQDQKIDSGILHGNMLIEIMKESFHDKNFEQSLLTYIQEISLENLMNENSELNKKINDDYQKLPSVPTSTSYLNSIVSSISIPYGLI